MGFFPREYHWANFATGLGASLHELGHTFDLAHTPSGIMARGFDDLHKVFIVQRSERTNESGDSSNDSNGSVMSLSSNSETENEPSSLVQHQAQRYKDVCYGSPLRKVFCIILQCILRLKKKLIVSWALPPLF